MIHKERYFYFIYKFTIVVMKLLLKEFSKKPSLQESYYLILMNSSHIV